MNTLRSTSWPLVSTPLQSLRARAAFRSRGPRWPGPLPFVSLASLLGLAGCGGGTATGSDRVCTEMGCSDQVSIRAELSADEAAAGEHRFQIEADGTTITCVLNHVDVTEAGSAECDGSAALQLGARMEMVEMPSPVPGTVMVGARAVPGAYEWTLTLYGRPTSVRVVHALSGTTLRDQSAAPTYAPSRPNGDGCDPVCQQAEVTWARP